MTGARLTSQHGSTAEIELVWEAARVAPNSATRPVDLDQLDLGWEHASVPGTVGALLSTSSRNQTPAAAHGLAPAAEFEFPDLDAQEWWYRAGVAIAESGRFTFDFGGLATLSEVWIDEEQILVSENMFLHHCVTLELEAGTHQLYLRFASLGEFLATKRPRPRWRTRLVAESKLRWLRTSFLGRMPTWPPRVAPLGPWRPITCAPEPEVRVERLGLSARLDGSTGIIQINTVLSGALPRGADAPATAHVLVAGTSQLINLSTDPQNPQCWVARGAITVTEPTTWMPHSHGTPTRYLVTLRIEDGAREHLLELGSVGFRDIDIDHHEGEFAVSVNGVRVFCRGACWVQLDPIGLNSTEAELREALGSLMAAGFNMVRITGTMAPEQDEFYELCDELGMMVFHDLMFANHDYPFEEESFRVSVRGEIADLLSRIGHRPSLALLCGGSEVSQQAAMWGADRSLWNPSEPRLLLEQALQDSACEVAIISSSPSGGSLPFQIDHGISHYYGVGAYLRDPQDARRAGLRFASECLAFAAPPEEWVLRRHGYQPAEYGVSQRWTAAIPKDHGADWDFEEVRDHYTQLYFGQELHKLRDSNPQRYLDLGRATLSHLFEQSLAEWRRTESSCNGALVFTARDLVIGPGWGMIDATGVPKSSYYGAARSCRPRAVSLIDEGLNGLDAYLHNDTEIDWVGDLTVDLWGSVSNGSRRLEQAHTTVRVPPHSSHRVRLASVLGRFWDLTHAYRFAEHTVDLVAITVTDSADSTTHGQPGAADDPHVSDRSRTAHFFPGSLGRDQNPELGLSAAIESAHVDVGDTNRSANRRSPSDRINISVSTVAAAQFVALDLPGYIPEDNWFHLAPGGRRSIQCRLADREAAQRDTTMTIRASNGVELAHVTS